MSVSGGNLLAVPYDIQRGGIEKSSRLLDHMCEHPMWFASSLTPEEIRVNAAWMLTNNEYHKWEVWDGGRLVGMLLLNRIIVPVDALFHFTFFRAQNLFAARKLVQNFLGFAFEQFGLRRISMEVPEHYPTIIRFSRQKLGFKYEGELDLERFQKIKTHLTSDNESMRAAVALYGSRREGAHWNPKTEAWSDVVLLRLTREEYLARASSVTTRDSSLTENRNDELGIAPSTVRPSPSPQGPTRP